MASAACFCSGVLAASAFPASSAALFFGGLVLIAASLNSPLETISAHYLLLMHLLQYLPVFEAGHFLLTQCFV